MDKFIAFALPLLICLSLISCNGPDFDTSWHVHHGSIHADDPASKQIKPGEDSWRFVREAVPGEELPNGKKAGDYDLLWEWRMELTNISDMPWQIKTRFFLVTLDNVQISVSESPPEKDKWTVLEPGEKKLFTEQAFIDKKYISRIAKGRGLVGKQPVEDK